MDAALRRNADFASKPCVLQHFGSPPFNSITSKYCKGYKFHKKEDFKMLKNRGVVPGPVTLFLECWKLGVFYFGWQLLDVLCLFFVGNILNAYQRSDTHERQNPSKSSASSLRQIFRIKKTSVLLSDGFFLR